MIRPLAGACPCIKRLYDALKGLHAGGDITDGYADPGGAVLGIFLGAEAAFCLHEQVIVLLLAVGAVDTVTGDRTADQRGMHLEKVLKAKPHAF